MKVASDIQKPYDQNPELNKMKQDIADRNYNLMIKGVLIAAGVTVAGALLGAIALPAFLSLVGAEGMTMGAVAITGGLGAMMGGFAGFAASGPVSHFMTMKDRKKLAIDEEMANSYMQGKNYWGAGYRQEVAERGYAGPAQQVSGQPRALRGHADAQREF